MFAFLKKMFGGGLSGGCGCESCLCPRDSTPQTPLSESETGEAVEKCEKCGKDKRWFVHTCVGGVKEQVGCPCCDDTCNACNRG